MKCSIDYNDYFKSSRLFLTPFGGGRHLDHGQTLSQVVVVDIGFGHRLDTGRTSIKGSADRWQWRVKAVSEGHIEVHALCHSSYLFSRESVVSIHDTQRSNRSAACGLETATWRRAHHETGLNLEVNCCGVNICLLVSK